jgi:aminoglycoside 3-N-acetyltransferase
MLNFRDVVVGLRGLKIDRDTPVIVHTSLSAFGPLNGGAQTLVGALLTSFRSVIMPTFTYKTMLIPEDGPPENAMLYGSGRHTNRMAEFYRPGMPADRLMGKTAEALRNHPEAQRSRHPILSFCGVNAPSALQAQTLLDPLSPFRVLNALEGWVLLLGVNHTVNTCIHYAEKLAGRRQFVRWALTPAGILECPGFPGCSDGFDQITPYLGSVTRSTVIGKALIQAVPIPDLILSVCKLIRQEPLALLCPESYCERCMVTRQLVENSAK